jgi:hypothetical protein
MEKIKRNWKKHFKHINLLLMNASNETEWHNDITEAGKLPIYDSTVFTDEYYGVPYVANMTTFDEKTKTFGGDYKYTRGTVEGKQTTIDKERYNAISDYFKNINIYSILCIKDNKTKRKKIFYIIAIEFPRQKTKEETGKLGTQNTYARILLKYYNNIGVNVIQEGIFTYSIFPAYPKTTNNVESTNYDYTNEGGYLGKYPNLNKAFKDDDNTSDTIFNIFDLRDLINTNRYSFNLIKTEGQMYIDDNQNKNISFKDNKEFLFDDDNYKKYYDKLS